MKRRRRRRFGVVVMGLALAVGVFFGMQFFTKTGIFKVPGVIVYAEDLNEDEKSLLESIFTEEVVLDADLTISVTETRELTELQPNQYLYSIKVPIADFYDPRADVAEFNETEVSYIPIEELDFTKKLLMIDQQYYLETFMSGAIFRVLNFESEKFAAEVEPLIKEALTREFPEKSHVLTLAQTGVTALSREMYTKLNQVGSATYFAEKIKNYLASFDLTHTSNEASFSNSATSNNICSDPRFLTTLTEIGLDIVELTGNHNLDCGNAAALETLELYRQNNMRVVGGGADSEEAAIPLEINEKGTQITMLAYNLSTGGATTGASPGANQYVEERAKTDIETAKARGDLVIVDIQYFECSAYDSAAEDTTCDFANSAAGDQIGLFRHLVDLGADVVVGTSAHQPQTYELYQNGEIYYGLGNLFFDQAWWPGTTRSLVLEHYFYRGKLLQTRITPTVYDRNLQTELMDEPEAKKFLQRLINARP